MNPEKLSHTTSKTNDIRQLGINPNYWYVVAASNEVKTQPIEVKLWNQNIVLFRDSLGKIQALENRCPHRQVKLSYGKIISDYIECAYHGWQFNSQGECALVPYLEDKQKLPKNCKIRAYPVQELDGFIWLFLGDNPNLVQPLAIPEWDNLNYIATVSVIHYQGHFSFLIENLMDMYHGHLHQDLQAWTDAQLEKIEETPNRVDAYYQAQSYYKIDKIWSISQLFFPGLRKLHPEPLRVSYIYPHWVSTLGEYFKIYCLLCPISLTETQAYLIHFTSLNAFWRLHKLPIKFRKFVKDLGFGSAQNLLDGLVKQDVLMIEEEQKAYLQNSQQKGYEFNPTIASVQRLINNQVER
ncbi:MAG: 3-chlorobenzoate-3,4-dioxygenase [Oscillatoriales cyanobacterium CG2_30_40_61]|nr:MAG: 3-chlorobenzoate-3,4-dioxygenase [Oscillatoriales cyanobacterium CG2_30_40_61]